MALSTSLQELSLALTQLDSALNVGGQIATTNSTPMRILAPQALSARAVAAPLLASSPVVIEPYHANELHLHALSSETISTIHHHQQKQTSSAKVAAVEKEEVKPKSAEDVSSNNLLVNSHEEKASQQASTTISQTLPIRAAKSAVRVLHFVPKKVNSGKPTTASSVTAASVVASSTQQITAPTTVSSATQLHSSKIYFSSHVLHHQQHSEMQQVGSSISVESAQLPRSASATVSVPSKNSDAGAVRLLQSATASSAAKMRSVASNKTSSSISTTFRSAELLQRIKEELARGADHNNSKETIDVSPLPPPPFEEIRPPVRAGSSVGSTSMDHVDFQGNSGTLNCHHLQQQEMKSSSSHSPLDSTQKPAKEAAAPPPPPVPAAGKEQNQHSQNYLATKSKHSLKNGSSTAVATSGAGGITAVKRYPQNDIFNRLYEKGTETHPAPKAVTQAKQQQQQQQPFVVHPQNWHNILRGKKEKYAEKLVASSSSSHLVEAQSSSLSHKPTSDIWKRLYKQARKQQESVISVKAANVVHHFLAGDGEETQPTVTTHPNLHQHQQQQHYHHHESKKIQPTHNTSYVPTSLQQKVHHPTSVAVVSAPPPASGVNPTAVIQRLYEREKDRRTHLDELRKKKEQEEAEHLQREREEILSKVKKIRELHKSKYYDINNMHSKPDTVVTVGKTVSVSPPPVMTNTNSPLLMPTGGDVPRRPSTGSHHVVPIRSVQVTHQSSQAQSLSLQTPANAVDEHEESNNKSFVLTPSGTWSRNVATVDPLQDSQANSKRLLHSRTSSYVTPISHNANDYEDVSFVQQNTMLVPHLDFSKIRR